MPIPVATTEPETIRKNSTVKWSKALADYSAADDWRLFYTFQGVVNATTVWLTDVNIAANGSDFSIVLSHTFTNALTAGDYWLGSYVTDAASPTERAEIAQTYLKVEPSFSDTSPLPLTPGSTHARKMVIALESMLQGHATREEQALTISTGGVSRTISMMSHSELIKSWSFWKSVLKSEIQAERLAKGKASGTKILNTYIDP